MLGALGHDDNSRSRGTPVNGRHPLLPSSEREPECFRRRAM